MEGIRPEIRKALEDMNWEQRLEEARARRRKVLAARAAASPVRPAAEVTLPEGAGPFLPPADGAANTTSPPASLPFPPATPPAPDAEPVPGPVANRRPVLRLAAASLLLAGGVGLWAALTFVPNEPPVTPTSPVAQAAAPALAPTVERSPTVLTAVIVPPPEAGSARGRAAPVGPDLPGAERPGPVKGSPPRLAAGDAQEPRGVPASAGIASRPPSGAALPEVWSVVQVPRGPEPMGPEVEGRPTLPGGDLVSPETRLARSPDAGRRPPETVAPVPPAGPADAAAPPKPVLLALLETPPRQPASGTGARLDPVIAPGARPGAIAPAAIDVPPARGVLPGIDAVPPSPVIPGAADMPTSIFAASTVDDGDLDAVREASEGFGLPVVTVARVGYRISENQVRYYDTGTGAAAARLAAAIGGVARDFTGSASDPPPGTLEVYLAGEAAEAPPPQPVASAPAPPARRPQGATERLRESVISRLRAGNPQ